MRCAKIVVWQLISDFQFQMCLELFPADEEASAVWCKAFLTDILSHSFSGSLILYTVLFCPTAQVISGLVSQNKINKNMFG